MRRIFIGIFIFSWGISACQAVLPVTSTPTPSVIPPSATSTQTPTKTVTATTTAIHPTPTRVPPTPTTSPIPPEFVLDVRTHPDHGLYVGDQVSFEVIPPQDMDLSEATLHIFDGSDMMEANFVPFGIGGRNQATLYWVWDTTGIEVGAQPLTFTIQPQGYTWTQTITLEPASEIPPPEPAARWVRAELDCCVFYYISETAAAREITATLALVDQRADHAINALGIDFDEPLIVNLMPRVLGQGGFASTEMYISFLDRNYAGNSLEMVLHHEMVHILDHHLDGELRPTILVEGLAVYLTGGHYKPEAMIPRAAALLAPAEREDGLGLDWYIPLRPLADDFYQSQHEIGYIQAGALVEYLVETWGWEAYSDFYRDIHPTESGTHSAAIDSALQAHFDLTLEELEADFLTMLKEQEINPGVIDDVRLTVEFFETMRRYQQILDPSAYFLTAWLPNGPLMREHGIVADLVRRPSEVENLAVETLLVAADAATDRGDYAFAIEALAAVNAVLGAIKKGQTAPFETHPMAQTHYDIASSLLEAGYQIQQINIKGETAQVVATQGWSELTIFDFSVANGNWSIVSGQ
jgi:hypothetical protein